MRFVPSFFFRQSGVIPFRYTGGKLEILLITSRRKGRWIVPKGVIEPRMSAAGSAEKEAVEEAGVLGTVYPESVGSYQYQKWGGSCTVALFLLEVETELDSWDESDVRQREWMSLAEAAAAVSEPELHNLILALPTVVQRLRGFR